MTQHYQGLLLQRRQKAADVRKTKAFKCLPKLLLLNEGTLNHLIQCRCVTMTGTAELKHEQKNV